MPADAASAVILAAFEGTVLSSEESAFLSSEGLAGFTLFRRNIPQDFKDLSLFLESLQSNYAGSLPFLMAVDQEGGRVRRLHEPFPNPGPAMQLAAGQSDAEALRLLRNTAYIQSRLLLDLGFNVNFAPVCDILTNQRNEAIGDRAFASDAATVAKRASAYLAGMNQAGIMRCLKHFPGQGDASEDTHLSGTVIECSRELLGKRELLPFLACLQDCPMVMIAHATYTSLDQKPASLSAVVIQDLLRAELGYAGLVVSDDMTMGAMPASDQEWIDAIIQSIMAGTDLILICKDLPRVKSVLAALRQRASKSADFARRLEEAAERVCRLRSTLTS